MRVALAQFAATTDPAENLRQVQAAVERAAAADARLAVFPEAMICSFARPRIEAAEPLDGSWASAVRTAARQAGITVIVGMFTPGASGKVRNTLLVTVPASRRTTTSCICWIHMVRAYCMLCLLVRW